MGSDIVDVNSVDSISVAILEMSVAVYFKNENTRVLGCGAHVLLPSLGPHCHGRKSCAGEWPLRRSPSINPRVGSLAAVSGSSVYLNSRGLSTGKSFRKGSKKKKK